MPTFSSALTISSSLKQPLTIAIQIQPFSVSEELGECSLCQCHCVGCPFVFDSVRPALPSSHIRELNISLWYVKSLIFEKYHCFGRIRFVICTDVIVFNAIANIPSQGHTTHHSHSRR